MNQIVNNYKKYFSNLNTSDEDILYALYKDNVAYKTSGNEFQGIGALINYFTIFKEDVVEGGFNFIEEDVLADRAYLSWEMNVLLKSTNEYLNLTGITVLKFSNKIYEQHDYINQSEYASITQ